MGAHLSSIQGTLREQFNKHDQGSKGYLTLKEVMAIRTLYGINPCHVGVLYQVDRNHDGRYTLEELQEYAAFAYSYARAHRSLDAGYMTAGYASLCMWRGLRNESGRREFVDWAMNCFMEGYELVELEGSDEPCIHRKALKALHVLFNMERNLGVDYQGLLDMMQCAAEEQQLLDPDNPDHDDWIPLEVLRLFTESLADGMSSIMESFFSDEAELDEVVRGVQSGIAASAPGPSIGASVPTTPVCTRKSSIRGYLVPHLNLGLQKQLQKA